MATQPLPRFLQTYESRVADAAKLEAVVRESGGDLRKERVIARDPSDALTLRGIPAVGASVGGAIRGTVPGANLRERET